MATKKAATKSKPAPTPRATKATKAAKAKPSPAKTTKKSRASSEDEVDQMLEAETGVRGKRKGKKGEDSGGGFDYFAAFNDTLDEISKRQGVDTDVMDVFKPMSTGLLALDILLGGGVKPAMYTSAGFEQGGKTTGALAMMGAAVTQNVPLIALWDYEGCFIADTYISYGRGKQAKLKDLFDLSEVGSWEPGTYPGQQRTDIDTVEPGHRYGGTGLRTGNLFYKGKKATTKVTFNTGHSLIGHGHKMYVLRNGYAAVVKMEELKVGEQVLVNRKFLEEQPEEWAPVKGFGPTIAQRYEVSTQGRVRSVDFEHVVTCTSSKTGATFNRYRTVKGKVLQGNPVKDGHLWVALCDGETQRKRLIHRIVARTFLGKAPKGKALVLHWNDDPADNRLTNIRYGSDKENVQDQIMRWRKARGEGIHTTTLTEEQVREIRNLHEEGYDYKDLASLFKVKVRRIKSICNRTHWKYVSGSEDVPFEVTEEILRDYELAAVTSVELTGKKEHVFDISLMGVNKDVLPHSIITNGVVTHNSTANSLDYVANVLRTMGVKIPPKDLFGRKDPSTGKWVVPPRVRYVAETRGEKFFDWLATVLKELPDKKFVAGKWWLVFDESNKRHKAQVGDEADKEMARKYGKGLWVPAPDGGLQGLVLVDSYPAMNPEANDDEEANNSLGLHARFFAKHLPRVKGRLAQKMVAMVGVNQLRQIPMAMYGPKEQEACGQALRFNCFSSDTLIQTDKGLLTALEASQSKLLEVHGVNGPENIGGWKSTGVSKIYAATTELGFQVRGKPGHKVLAVELSELAVPELEWKRMNKLSTGKKSSRGTYLAIRRPSTDDSNFPSDYLEVNYRAAVRQANQFDNGEFTSLLDETLGELLGWIVSEGYSRNYTVCISNNSADNLKRISRLAKKVRAGKVSVGDAGVTINGHAFCEWLTSIKAGGVLSRYKEVPRVIRQSPFSVQVAFLRGLFGGDGYSTSKETLYHSISNVLLEQVQTMLLSMGIVAKRNPYVPHYTEHRLDVALQYATVSQILNKENISTLNFKTGSLHLTGTSNHDLRTLLGWETSSLPEAKTNQETRTILPPLFGPAHAARNSKIVRWFDENIKKGATHFRVGQFYEGWIEEYMQWTNTLRTSKAFQAKAREIGLSIHKFVNYTINHDLVWTRLTDLSVQGEQATFDCNVPGTSTVLTNGVVSHNSDVRNWWNSRSSGMPFNPKFDTEERVEIERSIHGGKDRYRYVQVVNKKNKLAQPGRKQWVRIWVSNHRGEGSGFDPVFDTLQYLKETGQMVAKNRQKLLLKLDGFGEAKKPIDWMTAKEWILGDKATKTKISESLGYKPMCLRKFCFQQMAKGKGEELFVAMKNNGKVDEGDDE